MCHLFNVYGLIHHFQLDMVKLHRFLGKCKQQYQLSSHSIVEFSKEEFSAFNYTHNKYIFKGYRNWFICIQHFSSVANTTQKTCV